MKIFIPLTDDMLDDLDANELPVPYQAGLPPISQITDSVSAPHPVQSRKSNSSSPGLTSSSAALPALSSSTYMAGPALE